MAIQFQYGNNIDTTLSIKFVDMAKIRLLYFNNRVI